MFTSQELELIGHDYNILENHDNVMLVLGSVRRPGLTWCLLDQGEALGDKRYTVLFHSANRDKDVLFNEVQGVENFLRVTGSFENKGARRKQKK